jgi:hypothetical protein
MQGSEAVSNENNIFWILSLFRKIQICPLDRFLVKWIPFWDILTLRQWGTGRN